MGCEQSLGNGQVKGRVCPKGLLGLFQPFGRSRVDLFSLKADFFFILKGKCWGKVDRGLNFAESQGRGFYSGSRKRDWSVGLLLNCKCTKHFPVALS